MVNPASNSFDYKGITVYYKIDRTTYLYYCGQTNYFCSAQAAKLFISRHMKGHVNYEHHHKAA